MNFEEIFTKMTLLILKQGIKILFILLLTPVVNRVLKILLKRAIIRRIKNGVKDGRKKQRIETLVSIIGGTLQFLIWVTAIFAILSELGINTPSILAPLGIASLALGMAASSTVSDFISGIFIVLEGQIFVGDRVKISGIEGEVIDFNLRRTVIKDADGFLHFVPNSQIKIISKKIK